MTLDALKACAGGLVVIVAMYVGRIVMGLP